MFTAFSFFIHKVTFASLLLSGGSELFGAAGWVALAVVVGDTCFDGCAALLEAYIYLHLLGQALSPFFKAKQTKDIH